RLTALVPGRVGPRPLLPSGVRVRGNGGRPLKAVPRIGGLPLSPARVGAVSTRSGTTEARQRRAVGRRRHGREVRTATRRPARAAGEGRPTAGGCPRRRTGRTARRAGPGR